jgi:hypothetical protein
MEKQAQTNSNIGVFNDTVLKELAAAVKTIKYGQILITVHNSRVVQIDKTEKLRFDSPTYYDKGGGI